MGNAIKSKTIDIAFVFDDKFSDLFRVAIYSIAKNTKSNLAVHIVDCGIAEQNKDLIRKFISEFKNISSVEFKVPKRIEVLESYTIPTHFSTAIFYRLGIPKIFPELSRVIYLDCDIIAVGDISELWNEDLDGRPLGVIEEDGNFFNTKTKLRKMQEINLPENKHYYNSGVLLIDSKQFEKSQIFERVVDFVKNTDLKLSCPEQDAMNLCLDDDEHMALDPKYNFIPFASSSEECLKKIKEPIIIMHYAGKKPWEVNKKIIRFAASCGMEKYHMSMMLKYWEYADYIDKKKFSNGNIFQTLKFLYKCLFQPIEKFISRKCCHFQKSLFGQRKKKVH
ncbi:MAG: glycosyltransferase family 8 protein [Puniceicoccales bacterium]|jgi:lipopolysaccharide biosynthesis glycosyltransferase|nr:glycosyltransferase family 8 protein [Puniceicoccales bacterium]